MTPVRIGTIAPLALAICIPASVFAQAPSAPPPETAPSSATQAAPSAAPAPGGRQGRPLSRNSLRGIRERGVLRACIAPYAPWAIAAQDGSWSGYSIDIAKQLAEDLSVQVAFVPGGYGDVLQRLSEGDCDLLPAGLSPTPDRALFAHFSRAIVSHDIAIVAEKAAVGQWTAPSDLDRPEVSIGVVEDSIEASTAKRLFPKATLTRFPDHQELSAALQAGKIKALLASDPLPDLLMKQAPDKLAIVAGSPIARRSEALAVRRGDLEFLAFLNDWIQARSDDGWLKARADQWFSNLEWASEK